MRPACTMRPASITATESPSDFAAWKVLLHHQDRGTGLLQFRECASTKLWMIAGARPLVGSSISTSLRRLDDGARDRQHLLLAARQQLPAGRSQNFFIGGKNRKIQFQARFVRRPAARRQHQVLAHRQAGENAHRFGHVGDAEVGDRGGVCAGRDVRMSRSGSRPPRLATDRGWCAARWSCPRRCGPAASSARRAALPDPLPAGCGNAADMRVNA